MPLTRQRTCVIVSVCVCMCVCSNELVQSGIIKPQFHLSHSLLPALTYSPSLFLSLSFSFTAFLVDNSEYILINNIHLLTYSVTHKHRHFSFLQLKKKRKKKNESYLHKYIFSSRAPKGNPHRNKKKNKTIAATVTTTN